MAEWAIGIGALVALALLCGSEVQRRCALTIAANWLACTAFVEVTGQYTPWAWFWAMDLVSAIAVTLRPVGRFQRLLVYSYSFQIGFHAAYGMTDAGDDRRYLGALDAVLILQMLLVFVWIAADGVRHLNRFRGLPPLHHEARP